MICLSCAEPTPGSLCRACLGTLGPAPERYLRGALVRSGFGHIGAARRLVHRLKYEGLLAAAGPLAGAMALVLPETTTALVPVPRAKARRWRYGVDPAMELATTLSSMTGLPVLEVLRPAMWVAHRAGPAARHRGHPRFVAIHPTDRTAVLIDDVVTTGTTIGAAAAVTGLSRAVTATAGLRL